MAESALGLLVLGCSLLASLLLVLGEPDEVREVEFCQREDLKLQCSDDEVILLRTALLGRMRIGRCVKYDRGHMGCGTDVVDELDVACSGRRSCEVKFVTLTFKKVPNCPLDLASYLTVSYSCVTVARRPKKECEAAGSVQAPAAPGYLANIINNETSCGSMEHPWLIKVHPTQRVNLTLFDFGTLTYDGLEGRDVSQCEEYGVVRERKQNLWHRICREARRVRHEYLSAGDNIEVKLDTPVSTSGQHFILYYEAVGCSEPAVNPDTHWVRRGDQEHVAVVGCHSSSQTWELTCTYNTWTGTPGECTTDNVQSDVPATPGTKNKGEGSEDGDPGSSEVKEGSSRLSTIAISLAVVGGLVLCISLLVIGLLFDCRRTNRKRRNAEVATPPKECSLTKKYVRRSRYEPKEDELEEVTSSGGGGGGQKPAQRNGVVSSIEVQSETPHHPTQNGTLPRGSGNGRESSPVPPRRTTSKFASLKAAVNGTLKQGSGAAKKNSKPQEETPVVVHPPKLQSKKNGVPKERPREKSPDSDSDNNMGTVKRAPPKNMSSIDEDKSQEIDMPTYAVCNKKERTKPRKQTRKPKPTPRVSKMRPPAVPAKKNVHGSSSDSDNLDEGYERPVTYGPPGAPPRRRNTDGSDSESSDEVPHYFELDPRYTGVLLMERSDSASSQESAPEEDAVRESLA